MKISKLSQSKNREEFITRFATIGEKLNPHSSAASCAHLLTLFSEKEKELIIVSDNDKDLGRICVNATSADRETLLFGFLEYDKSNKEVLKQLMDEAKTYAQSLKCKKILGPIDLNVWFSNRFKMQGFDDQRSWEPNSPKEYLDQTLSLGYVLDQDYLSCFYADLMTCHDRTKPAYDNVIKNGYSFRKMDLSRENETEILYKINIAGFSKNYFYEPISYEQYVNSHILALKDSDLQYSSFILDPSGRELGYVYAFIDSDQRLIIKSLVMDPAHRGAKLSSALVHTSMKLAHENGIISACGACVRKGNVSEHFFDHLGEKERTHTYTLVRLDLN